MLRQPARGDAPRGTHSPRRATNRSRPTSGGKRTVDWQSHLECLPKVGAMQQKNWARQSPPLKPENTENNPKPTLNSLVSPSVVVGTRLSSTVSPRNRKSNLDSGIQPHYELRQQDLTHSKICVILDIGSQYLWWWFYYRKASGNAGACVSSSTNCNLQLQNKVCL